MPSQPAAVTQTVARPVRRRRRGTAVEKAISDAVLVELAEVGFGRLTFESVAERAGTGKSPLYRRWPDTTSLVIDTLEKLGSDPAHFPRTRLPPRRPHRDHPPHDQDPGRRQRRRLPQPARRSPPLPPTAGPV